MDLVSWSLNAIDQIFSTRRQGVGEPSCPDGTLAAGYTMDSWSKWKIVCLASLYIEDTEDVYIFGLMVTGFLLFGAGGYLVYRKIRKLEGGNSLCKDGMIRALNGNSAALGELSRRQDAALEQNRKLMDVVLERGRKLSAVLELTGGSDKNSDRVRARVFSEDCP